MNIIICVLIDLKWKIKEDTVFVMKAETLELIVHLKQIHSSFCSLIAQNILCFFFREYKNNDIFKKKER